MNIIHAIIIIAIMFCALVAWNIWWLFFSTESIIIKRKSVMTTPKIEGDRSKWELQKKLERMNEKRATLEVELVADYNPEKLRELNILDHHINVTTQRISGEWVADETAPITPLVKSGKQHLVNAWQ